MLNTWLGTSVCVLCAERCFIIHLLVRVGINPVFGVTFCSLKPLVFFDIVAARRLLHFLSALLRFIWGSPSLKPAWSLGTPPELLESIEQPLAHSSAQTENRQIKHNKRRLFHFVLEKMTCICWFSFVFLLLAHSNHSSAEDRLPPRIKSRLPLKFYKHKHGGGYYGNHAPRHSIPSSELIIDWLVLCRQNDELLLIKCDLSWVTVHV